MTLTKLIILTLFMGEDCVNVTPSDLRGQRSPEASIKVRLWNGVQLRRLALLTARTDCCTSQVWQPSTSVGRLTDSNCVWWRRRLLAPPPGQLLYQCISHVDVIYLHPECVMKRRDKLWEDTYKMHGGWTVNVVQLLITCNCSWIRALR